MVYEILLVLFRVLGLVATILLAIAVSRFVFRNQTIGGKLKLFLLEVLTALMWPLLLLSSGGRELLKLLFSEVDDEEDQIANFYSALRHSKRMRDGSS